MAALAKNGALWTSIPRRVPIFARGLHASTACPQLAATSEDELRNARPFKEVPGPKVFPVVGSIPGLLGDAPLMGKQFHKFFEKQTKKYGPIFTMKLPHLPQIVVLTDPDDCEKMVRATMQDPKRPALESLRRVRQEAVDNYFERGLGIFNENGEAWWRVRSRVQTPMMKPQIVAKYLEDMDKVSLEFMDKIAALQAEHGEMPSDFQFEMHKWALESVGVVALSRRLGCLNPDGGEDSDSLKLIEINNDIFQLVNNLEFSVISWKYFPSPGYKKLKMRNDEFVEIADRNIRETEAALMAKDPNNLDELTLMESLLLREGLTRKDVVTLIMDMLFAGIDTTSHTLGFTLYLLARNPEAQAKLQAEVDEVLGDYKGPLLPKHLAQFSYMKAVLKESLRLFPLTPGISRENLRDDVYGGYVIPKGYLLMAFNMLIGWDEKYFPRAKEFLPERWSRDRPLGPIHPYASLPFGTGTRMCIGRRIAEQEMFTFLARTMHRFNVDHKYKDLDIQNRLVFMPSEPLRFSFTERK